MAHPKQDGFKRTIRVCPKHGDWEHTMYPSRNGSATWYCMECFRENSERRTKGIREGTWKFSDMKKSNPPKTHPVCKSCFIEHPENVECY